MIFIEIQEWQEIKAKLARLQQEVEYLRNQNIKLKTHLNHQNQPDSCLSSSGSISIIDDVKQMYAVQDLIDEQKDQFKLHPEQPAHARSQNYIDFYKQNSDEEEIDEIRVSRKSQRSNELKSLISSQKSSEKQETKQLHLIQEICVFGPSLTLDNLSQITFKNDERQFVEPDIYYPSNAQHYQKYGSYLFPNRVRIKPTQKGKIAIEANKTIFKSSKKPESNIFIFQGNEHIHPIKGPHQMLQTLNPSKWLYGMVIEFEDFVFKQIKIQKQNSINIGASFSTRMIVESNKKRGSLLELDLDKEKQKQILLQTVSLKDIELEGQKLRMYRSTFYLCIFTYFPFINYLQSMLITIFDQIKLRRIENFSKTGQFKDCDIFQFIRELEKLSKSIKSCFEKRSVKIGKQFTVQINEVELQIDLSREYLHKELFSNWAYRLLKIMDKDTFYDIYCMVMLEQSVTFLCENPKVLTFMILLFASMLSKPFAYPYPVVSILFTEELLHNPFTSIGGIKQSEAWLQEAIESGVMDIANKQIVIITESQVKIKRTASQITPKSQALYKIFTKFYKNIQPSSLTMIPFQRNSISINENAKQADEYVIEFYTKLQLFYHDNIFAYLPSHLKFERKTQSEEESNKVKSRNDFLYLIEKEYKKSHPDHLKDQFIKQFIKTEIFSIYLMDQYHLND